MLIAVVFLILNITGLNRPLWWLLGWIPFSRDFNIYYLVLNSQGILTLFALGLIFFLIRYTRFLYIQYIVHEWTTVIEASSSHAATFHKLVDNHFTTFKIPGIWGSLRSASPYSFRWLGWLFLRLGRRRACFAMEHDSFALSPYQGYIFAYSYGSALHVTAYVIMEVGPVRRIVSVIPFIGPLFSKIQLWPGGFAEPFLNLYDRQDLIAFGSVTFGVWREAMYALVISLNLPPKEQKIHTRGFLGITP